MSVEDFRKLYERHIDAVASGDLKAVLADMAAERIPAMMDGVSVPRGDVSSFEIKDVFLEGERGIGDTIYTTERGVIGLRSIWEHREEGWKAIALENFSVS